MIDPPSPPPSAPLPADSSPEDLAKLFIASGAIGAVPSPVNRGSLRKKLALAFVIGGIGVGASVMSCVGQSFSLRQARALEGIEHQLKELRVNCTAAPRPTVESPQ